MISLLVATCAVLVIGTEACGFEPKKQYLCYYHWQPAPLEVRHDGRSFACGDYVSATSMPSIKYIAAKQVTNYHMLVSSISLTNDDKFVTILF